MQLEKLRHQIRLEQLRYLYNDDLLTRKRIGLHWSNAHIPKQFIFNNQRRRLKGVPHAEDRLYCRPFFVWSKHRKVYSHRKDGKFIREAIKCYPETETMLMELTRMVMSKTKCDWRMQQDLFADAYCALLERFREVDTNRKPQQVFNWLLTVGINAIKNINKEHRKWDYYHHELPEYI